VPACLYGCCAFTFFAWLSSVTGVCAALSQGVPLQRLPVGHRVRPPHQPGGLGSSSSHSWIRESTFLQPPLRLFVVARITESFAFPFCWVQAKGSMEKSMVADNDSGKSLMSQVRTSSGAFLAKHEVITLHRAILPLLARSREIRPVDCVSAFAPSLSSSPSHCAPALAR
jgi:hypothetical protein